MHRGPAWPWGDGGCSPFKGAVFWGLSDLTQARGWDPSCVPSPPAPYLRRPLSWSAQAAAVGHSRPAPHSWVLLAPREPPKTASSGGALALWDPCVDVGENSRTPSSPTHSPQCPRTRVALQPSAHPSCPGEVHLSSTPFPSPAFVPQGFPALPQTRSGGRLHSTSPFPGQQTFKLAAGAPRQDVQVPQHPG